MNQKAITERARMVFKELKSRRVVKYNRDFLGVVGIHDSTASVILAPKDGSPEVYLPKNKIDPLIEYWGINRDYLYHNEGEMFNENAKGFIKNVKHSASTPVEGNARFIGEIFPGEEETNFRDLGNGELLMLVPEVDMFSMAGYLEHIQDKEWIDDLPTVEMIVEKTARGRYLAFKVRGESMTDGTEKSIPHGATVIGREIQREIWYPRFHTHNWEEYIIVQKSRILVKSIKDQDFKKGTIVLSSYNPDKEMYPDEEINIDEIEDIFNVIEVRVKRRR